jgi:trimeric autotransporter adhesin
MISTKPRTTPTTSTSTSPTTALHKSTPLTTLGQAATANAVTTSTPTNVNLTQIHSTSMASNSSSLLVPSSSNSNSFSSSSSYTQSSTSPYSPPVNESSKGSAGLHRKISLLTDTASPLIADAHTATCNDENEVKVSINKQNSINKTSNSVASRQQQDSSELDGVETAKAISLKYSAETTAEAASNNGDLASSANSSSNDNQRQENFDKSDKSKKNNENKLTNFENSETKIDEDDDLNEQKNRRNDKSQKKDHEYNVDEEVDGANGDATSCYDGELDKKKRSSTKTSNNNENTKDDQSEEHMHLEFTEQANKQQQLDYISDILDKWKSVDFNKIKVI